MRHSHPSHPWAAALAGLAMALGATAVCPAEPAREPAAGAASGSQAPVAPTPSPAMPGEGAAGPSKGDPTAPPPTIPRTAPPDKPPAPTQGQGTVKGSRANPAADGQIPGGRTGSGGSKSNEFGR